MIKQQLQLLQATNKLNPPLKIKEININPGKQAVEKSIGEDRREGTGDTS